MLCTVLPATSVVEALALAESAPTRCVEVRADFLGGPGEGLEAVEALSSAGLRVVATLRLRGKGGLYAGPPADAARFASMALERGAWLADVDVRVIRARGVPAGSGVLASIHASTARGVASAVEELLSLEGVEYVKVVLPPGAAGVAAGLVEGGGGRVSAYLAGRGPESVLSRALAEILGAPVVYGVHDSVHWRVSAAPPISAVAGALRASGWEGWL
jgi:3-dehydroquinate dehydratase